MPDVTTPKELYDRLPPDKQRLIDKAAAISDNGPNPVTTPLPESRPRTEPLDAEQVGIALAHEGIEPDDETLGRITTDLNIRALPSVDVVAEALWAAAVAWPGKGVLRNHYHPFWREYATEFLRRVGALHVRAATAERERAERLRGAVWELVHAQTHDGDGYYETCMECMRLVDAIFDGAALTGEQER